MFFTFMTTEHFPSVDEGHVMLLKGLKEIETLDPVKKFFLQTAVSKVKRLKMFS